MSTHFATYTPDHDGTIRHWLACGPVASRLTQLAQVLPETGSPHGHQKRWTLNYWAYHPEVIQLKQRVHARIAPFDWSPGALPVLDQPAPGGLRWRYAVTQEDRMLDFSRFNFQPSAMRGWAFTILHSEQAETLPVEIYTIGPVQLWLNDALAYQYDDTFSYVAPLTVKTELHLQPGANHLYLHGLMMGWREARLALGLRLLETPPLAVRLPIGAVEPAQWSAADTGLAHLKLKQFAFPDNQGSITLDEAAPAPLTVDVTVTIPDIPSPWGQYVARDIPHAAARLTLQPGESAALPLTETVAGAMARLPGENTLDLTIRPVDGTPIQQRYKIWLSTNRYSHQPYGDYESRRQEALEHLASMDYDVFAAMAAIETGRKTEISPAAVAIACGFLQNRFDCADFYALSLLALLYRFGDHPALLPAEREQIETTFLNFKFWIDEPGLDGMCYCTENHQILFHVTGYLAGQFWRDRVFANSGYTGAAQMRRALDRIQSWILRRLAGGFSEWDSNAYLTMDVFAMLALVEFAESPRLREMATTLLHKTFFMIASQSFRGAHGSTHGRCYVEGLKSARVENTANLQRIGWGMGIFNGETRATGLLAMARRYRVPDILQKIGGDTERTVVTRARSHAAYRPQFDMHSGTWDVRTITRRSPDTMLAAAVNHRPGAMGVQQHLWQATLSPEAAVFTTYPGNSQEHGQARPNFWAGSVRLPRVALSGRTALCLYQVEAGIGLGFTHAYFPTAAFDEWTMAGQWAFARVGAGYVALWGDGDLRLTEHGAHAGQELRSSGAGEAWLCHVGSAAEDGDFTAFRGKVMQHTPQPGDSALRWRAPEGSELSLRWEGPFMVNGQPVNEADFSHYDNTYTHTPLGADVMELRFGDDMLRLDLRRGRVLE
ncbi:MAG: hypothetical protein H6671_07405 [Anaerolineaceae bacterium]|nr:hypothetical protein [Anaerolineaceae bacterium]